jgi:hypothetical protein
MSPGKIVDLLSTWITSPESNEVDIGRCLTRRQTVYKIEQNQLTYVVSHKTIYK